MRKISRIILIVATAACLAAGCAKVNESETPAGCEITITATLADSKSTRTSLKDGGTEVFWESGDEIKLFYDGTGSRFTNQLTELSGTAKFTGSLNVMFGSNEGFSDSTPLIGLYPYRSDATADNESVTTTLPSEQIGKAGSFARGTNISLGKSSSLSMGFYNVCGGVRFSLTHEGVNAVTFTSLAGEPLAGKVKLAFDGAIPMVKEVSEGQSSITLTAPAGGTFETGKWYYIVALPGTLSGGFEMIFNTADKYAILESSNPRTITRGIFGSLANADEGLKYKDKSSPEPSGENISFKDAAAKTACVEKFDKDGDGEVSYDEAKAVTSISGLFSDYNTVKSFDELKYFTGVTNLGSAVKGLKYLKSITIPEGFTVLDEYAFDGCSALDSVSFAGNSLKSVGWYAFKNCSALKVIEMPSSITSIGDGIFEGCSLLASITLPSSLNKIGQNAFLRCAALESIEIPSGVNVIPYACFQSCSSLENIGLPSGLEHIEASAFSGCKAISSIDLPAGLTTVGDSVFHSCIGLNTMSVPDAVTSFGSYVFQDCTSLESVVLPSGLKTVPEGTFYGCTKLYDMIIPSAVSEIGDYAFYGCRLMDSSTNVSKIYLPGNVIKIGNKAFNAVHNVLVNSTSMVSISSSDTFDIFAKLYVPDSNVEKYKMRTNWSQHADNIFVISSYSDKSPTYEAVDLGLSVKWASCNVGALWPEDYGEYFAWGETETKSVYDISTYKWYKYNRPTKYNTSSSSGSTIDNKTVLDADDDVANVKWGGSWRMPTYAEWAELKQNCTWAWTTLCGIEGMLLTSKKSGYTGKSIFLPGAGSRNGSNSSFGYYWSSSLITYYCWEAWCMKFTSGGIIWYNPNRCSGLSVRPVTE